ncbi:hypothetical protein AYM40_03195 [Paraburkholderia phytofirmans OLGA172]|uniref:Uncharacterized protein n=1 Tax=Paraburkholderia phytofirmans OLGA172 TaxID=1417228 RepID=A0A160FHG6_9BURK|nr:hypothetical protein [Paraburkholderia phytofirmans]ANB71484.1 hypothetical protein AYM40_03195 [Paraburkholderia phytofirmans OLGA172]
MTRCAVCSSHAVDAYQKIDDIAYYICGACGSMFADPGFLRAVEDGTVSNYRDTYWEMELRAAKERAYGSSLQRIAETFFYSRVPITRFVDIGSGPGYLLDAVAAALPDATDMFYGVELFPPEPAFRSKHPNYKLCPLADVDQKFEGGVCIEVIEHLTPSMLDTLAKQMAQTSAPEAVYLINSGQPNYVLKEDPGYLDPHGRGHIMSYSLEGARRIFEPHGFTVIPLPGRHWAFLVEYQSKSTTKPPIEQLEARIWSPIPENAATLRDGSGGSLMFHAGLDSARCYLEHATAVERMEWVRSLQADIERVEGKFANKTLVHDTSAETGSPIDHAGFFGRARRWVQRHAS